MSLTKRTRLLIIGLLALISTAFIAYKIVYKPHTTIEDRDIHFTGTVSDLMEKVQADAIAWTDKVVEIKGTIDGAEADSFSLDGGVYCQLKPNTEATGLASGKAVIVKGRIIGYDDLLEELKLDQVIIKN